RDCIANTQFPRERYPSPTYFPDASPAGRSTAWRASAHLHLEYRTLTASRTTPNCRSTSVTRCSIVGPLPVANPLALGGGSLGGRSSTKAAQKLAVIVPIFPVAPSCAAGALASSVTTN